MKPERGSSDRLWTISGALLAVLAFAGAVIEIRTNDGTPKVNGGEHLALFARPAHLIDQKSRAPDNRVRVVGPLARALEAGVDFDATATIAKDEKPVSREGAVAIGWPDLKSVSRGRGEFRTPSGTVMLGVGDTVPSGGVILSFRRVDGRWVAMATPPQTSR